MKKQTIEILKKQCDDLERAAWFARLAFGCLENVQAPAPKRKSVNPGFNVLP